MGRYLAGVASALMLAAAGFFLWSGLANRDAGVPPPPGARMLASAVGLRPPVADPPQATDKTREEKRFSRYDHNHDGKVDRDEYLAARRRAFAKLDTNGDGKLSFEEYAIKTETKFGTADADKSGALDAAEFATTRVIRKARAGCPPAAAAPAPAEADEG